MDALTFVLTNEDMLDLLLNALCDVVLDRMVALRERGYPSSAYFLDAIRPEIKSVTNVFVVAKRFPGPMRQRQLRLFEHHPLFVYLLVVMKDILLSDTAIDWKRNPIHFLQVIHNSLMIPSLYEITKQIVDHYVPHMEARLFNQRYDVALGDHLICCDRCKSIDTIPTEGTYGTYGTRVSWNGAACLNPDCYFMQDNENGMHNDAEGDIIVDRDGSRISIPYCSTCAFRFVNGIIKQTSTNNISCLTGTERVSLTLNACALNRLNYNEVQRPIDEWKHRIPDKEGAGCEERLQRYWMVEKYAEADYEGKHNLLLLFTFYDMFMHFFRDEQTNTYYDDDDDDDEIDNYGRSEGDMTAKDVLSMVHRDCAGKFVHPIMTLNRVQFWKFLKKHTPRAAHESGLTA